MTTINKGLLGLRPTETRFNDYHLLFVGLTFSTFTNSEAKCKVVPGTYNDNQAALYSFQTPNDLVYFGHGPGWVGSKTGLDLDMSVIFPGSTFSGQSSASLKVIFQLLDVGIEFQSGQFNPIGTGANAGPSSVLTGLENYDPDKVFMSWDTRDPHWKNSNGDGALPEAAKTRAVDDFSLAPGSELIHDLNFGIVVSGQDGMSLPLIVDPRTKNPGG